MLEKAGPSTRSVHMMRQVDPFTRALVPHYKPERFICL